MAKSAMWWRVVRVLLMLLLLSPLYGAGWLYWQYYQQEQSVVKAVVRYKLVVVFDTPEGKRSGYSVREWSGIGFKKPMKIFKFPNSAPVGSSHRGEAAVVDLGARGKAFALLSGYGGFNYSDHLIRKAFKADYGPEGLEYLSTLKVGERRYLEPEYYPRIVTFSDILDPSSMGMVVDRIGGVSDGSFLDKSMVFFGANVRLKEVYVEITDEDLSFDIRNHLPWIDYYFEDNFPVKSTDGSICSNNLCRYSSFSFSTKEY